MQFIKTVCLVKFKILYLKYNFKLKNILSLWTLRLVMNRVKGQFNFRSPFNIYLF